MRRSGRCGDDTGRPGQSGAATLLLPMILWVTTLLAIVAIDVGGYLVAAARAQSLADAAALAAVSADATVPRSRSPVAEADRVARAGDGLLETCSCHAGAERAVVSVSVSAPGLVIPTLGASRVTADAAATLAPPADDGSRPRSDRPLLDAVVGARGWG